MGAIIPMHSAIYNGDVEAVKRLLLRGEDINAFGTFNFAPLHHSAASKKCEIVKLLLRNGAFVDCADKKGSTPLFIAARNGSSDIVRELLKHGAVVNCTTNCIWHKGNSPLHFAIESGNAESVEMLLDHQADIHFQNWCQEPPLHTAALTGNETIIKILLDKGAVMGIKDKDGLNEMNKVVRSGRKEGLKALLDYNADPNFKDDSGLAPLHTAISMNRKDLVLMLLEYGADINIMDSKGKAIFHYASRNAALSNIFCEHNVKLNCAKHYLNEMNLRWISVTPDGMFQLSVIYNHLYSACLDEIDTLKRTTLNDNKNVSFYNILTASENQLTTYCRNVNITQGLELVNIKARFKLYGNILLGLVKKGRRRRKLFDECSAVLRSSYGVFQTLPQMCLDRIFSCLDDDDLKNAKESVSID